MPFFKCYSQPKPLRSRIIAAQCERNGWRQTIYDSPHCSYLGEWKNSRKHGFGIETCRNSLFIGMFDEKHGYRSGISAIKEATGESFNIEYRGEWEGKHYHGEGVKHYASGDVYKGTFNHSKRHGFGQMWIANGGFYCGEWLHDKRDGFGVFVQVNQNRYEGNWRNDKKHGKGRFYHLTTGQYQEGTWEEDNCATSVIKDGPFRQTSLFATKRAICGLELSTRVNRNKS